MDKTMTVVIDMINWPEALFTIRQELARQLREEADSDGDPRVTRKLRDVADRFEIGQA